MNNVIVGANNFGGSIGMMGSGDDPNGYFVDILEMEKEDKDPTFRYDLNLSTFKKEVNEEVVKSLK